MAYVCTPQDKELYIVWVGPTVGEQAKGPKVVEWV